MPALAMEDLRNELNDDVYASADLSVIMPKIKMPEREHSARRARTTSCVTNRCVKGSDPDRHHRQLCGMGT
jgi:hypothetical protein